MDESKLYWVCLQLALGCGSGKISNIIDTFKTAANFFKSGEKEWRYSNIFSSKEMAALKKMNLNKAQEVLDECKNRGYNIVTIEDGLYPNRLKNIYNPPVVLYTKGILPKIDSTVSIAIVGTRNATQYGISTAFDFGYKLAKSGVIVVSGGALGIDSSAQKGAALAKGQVISVLGCGLNSNYLIENKTLRDVISKNGALVTEFLPNREAMPQNFPMRNRIISGLSLGTLIVEAGKKSGSLITANFTLEQNRDLFAIPGDIKNAKSMGTNRLIKECAKPVTCVEDILEEYYTIDVYNKDQENKEALKIHKKEKAPAKKVNLNGLSERAKTFYNALDLDYMHVDKLIQKAGISPSDAMQAITELEIRGLIKEKPGKQYAK